MTRGPRRRFSSTSSQGKSEGKLFLQAELPESCAGGCYVPPTIFTDVDPKAKLAQEEILGPVLAVIRANDFAHALAIANDTPYALTGGVFSRSPAHIEQARTDLEVGNLYINRRITGSQVDAQPFGGVQTQWYRCKNRLARLHPPLHGRPLHHGEHRPQRLRAG